MAALWMVLLCLLLPCCGYFKKYFSDIEVEDTYPISHEQQLSYRQGKFNSIQADFDINIPNIFNKKETKQDALVNQEKREQIATRSSIDVGPACDVFTIALDYITGTYSVKQIDSDRSIIITEPYDGNQITIFAKNLDTLKVNSHDSKLSMAIKDAIESRCIGKP